MTSNTLKMDRTDIEPDATEQFKAQAKRLRKALAARDVSISHAGSLELLAQSHGYRDWNTAVAMARRNIPTNVSDLGIGKRFAGSYLGHAVTGLIRSVTATATPGVFRVEVHLDEAVDVVESKLFHGYRQRIGARINQHCEPVLTNGMSGPGLSIDLLLPDQANA
jgi:hypothetical protein